MASIQLTLLGSITSTFLYSFEKQICVFDFEIDARDEDGGNIEVLQFMPTKGSNTKASLKEPFGNVDSK